MDTHLCTRCRQRKPIDQMGSRRRCLDCLRQPKCRVCGEHFAVEDARQAHYKLCPACRATVKERKAAGAAALYQANREAMAAQSQAWKQANRESYLPQQRAAAVERRATIRRKVLDHYGGACVCCGETEPLFLTIDHIDGNGAQHRAMIGKTDMWSWLVGNDFPPGFQLLCANCNTGRYRNGGRCPHEHTRRSAIPDPHRPNRGGEP